MPRISEALQAVSTTIESTIFICLIESSSEEEEGLEDDLEDLAIIYASQQVGTLLRSAS